MFLPRVYICSTYTLHHFFYISRRTHMKSFSHANNIVLRRDTFFCLLLGPPGFNCWFSSAPVFRWCCSTPQGSPGVGRNTFLSSPHLCFIIVFICDLFVSRDVPLMS